MVAVEQPVLDAGEAGVPAALRDEHVVRLVDVHDRHPVDRTAPVVAGGGVHDVVGADDQRRVGGREAGVDLVQVGDHVVGHAGVGEQHVHVSRHAAGHRLDGERTAHDMRGLRLEVTADTVGRVRLIRWFDETRNR